MQGNASPLYNVSATAEGWLGPTSTLAQLLAARFGLDAAEVEQAISDGPGFMRIASAVDHEEANRLRDILARIGVVAFVQPVEIPSTPQPQEHPPKQVRSTPRKRAAAKAKALTPPHVGATLISPPSAAMHGLGLTPDVHNPRFAGAMTQGIGFVQRPDQARPPSDDETVVSLEPPEGALSAAGLRLGEDAVPGTMSPMGLPSGFARVSTPADSAPEDEMVSSLQMSSWTDLLGDDAALLGLFDEEQRNSGDSGRDPDTDTDLANRPKRGWSAILGQQAGQQALASIQAPSGSASSQAMPAATASQAAKGAASIAPEEAVSGSRGAVPMPQVAAPVFKDARPPSKRPERLMTMSDHAQALGWDVRFGEPTAEAEDLMALAGVDVEVRDVQGQQKPSSSPNQAPIQGSQAVQPPFADRPQYAEPPSSKAAAMRPNWASGIEMPEPEPLRPLRRSGPSTPSEPIDPRLPAVLSAVVPGLGQVFNGQILKGLLFGTTFWLVVPWIWSGWDAWQVASTPPKEREGVVASDNSLGARLGRSLLFIVVWLPIMIVLSWQLMLVFERQINDPG
ncbi:MAG: hypothetical protein AAFS10_11820, partial [Myxococcota bacterium]